MSASMVEAAISGEGAAVPAEQRDYVRDIGAAPTAREKLAVYAAAMGRIQSRLAPLLLVLRHAEDPGLTALWDEIGERRAANMRRFAADLAATGELAVAVDEAADVVWATNSAEFFDLLVMRRGWSVERYASWLADAWARLLLR